VDPRQIEELKRRFTGRRVVVDPQRPELRRWAGVQGRIKTINQNGAALVEFDDPDHAWHDISLRHLQMVEE
jgi:hypothetical protein